MTREEKIEFLSRYKEIDDEINRLCEELSVWRARVTKITPTYSSLPKGSQQDDKLQSAIEKIMELEQEINAEINVLQKTRKAIVLAVCTIQDRSLRKLLALRYLNRKENLTWEQIANRMNYAGRHIFRLHNLALDMIQLKDSIECSAASVIP